MGVKILKVPVPDNASQMRVKSRHWLHYFITRNKWNNTLGIGSVLKHTHTYIYGNNGDYYIII